MKIEYTGRLKLTPEIAAEKYQLAVFHETLKAEHVDHYYGNRDGHDVMEITIQISQSPPRDE